MAKFKASEWATIRQTLNADPARYGLPARIYGSVVAASANVRKLGAKAKRDRHTWQFFADVFRHFDLLAVQEVLDDMEGLYHLKDLMGPQFDMIVSDTTGSFPNEGGLAERLAFIYNRNLVERTGLVTDVTYDRSKVLQIIGENVSPIRDAVEKAKANADYKKKLKRFEVKLKKARDEGKKEPVPPVLPVKMPVFVSFIRTPFAVMFDVVGHPGAERYRFLAVNAHLFFGNFIDDRRQEFNALLSWILGRVQEQPSEQLLNVVLLGDLNLDFDNPRNDIGRILGFIEGLNRKGGTQVDVHFPFLHPHPVTAGQQLMGSDGEVLQTNARLTETFDQIGIFSCEPRLKRLADAPVGEVPTGPDFGVFDFVNLFAESLEGGVYASLPEAKQKALIKRFEHSVSDHMPLWYRLPLPNVPEGMSVGAPE